MSRERSRISCLALLDRMEYDISAMAVMATTKAALRMRVKVVLMVMVRSRALLVQPSLARDEFQQFPAEGLAIGRVAYLLGELVDQLRPRQRLGHALLHQHVGDRSD